MNNQVPQNTMHIKDDFNKNSYNTNLGHQLNSKMFNPHLNQNFIGNNNDYSNFYYPNNNFNNQMYNFPLYNPNSYYSYNMNQFRNFNELYNPTNLGSNTNYQNVYKNDNNLISKNEIENFQNMNLNDEQNEESNILITNCNISNINNYLYEFTNSNIKSSNNKYAIIKSIDEDNILKALKTSLWTSTQKGNAKLNSLFHESDGNVYLFFSVNKSGKFCAIAKMLSVADTNNLNSNKDKWKGYFKLRWLVLKDAPNHVFKNVLNEYNEKKSVAFSRDSQEVDKLSGKSMMKLYLDFPYIGSIVNDNFFKNQNLISTFNENYKEGNSSKSLILSYKS